MIDWIKQGIDDLKSDDSVIESILTVQKEFGLSHKDVWGEELQVDLVIQIWKFKIPIKGVIKRKGLPLPALLEYARQIRKWSKAEAKAMRKANR